MKCEICHNGDAKVAIHKTVDGVDKELYVCQKCADEAAGAKKEDSKSGFKGMKHIELPDPTEFLSGLLKQLFDGSMETASILDNPTSQKFGSPCPTCGMTPADYKRTSRLGCPDCYKHFADTLAPVIRDMQPGASHVGKVPSTATLKPGKEPK